MSVEEKLLFLEKVVSILVAERNGVELEREDEEMLDEVFREVYYN